LLPSTNVDPVSHFLAGVKDMFEHALQNVGDSDMVGMTIQNQVNQSDKLIAISFRRKDQLSRDVILCVFEKVSQSNSRYNALDNLVVNVNSVKMPVGFSRGARDTCLCQGATQKSIIEFKAPDKCLAQALIIAIARIANDSNYESYRKGWKIRPVVRDLLEKTCIDPYSGAGIPELARLQEHFRQHKILLYQGFSCDNIMFEGRV